MAIRPRSGKWHYRFSFRGQEYSGTTDLDATARNKSAARDYERQIRWRLKGLTTPATAVRFSEAAAEFLTWCAESEYRGKQSTARRIKTSFASIGAFFGSRGVDDLTAGDVEQFKTWRSQTHQVRDVTIRHDLDALSLFFKYGRKRGWCASNPVMDVKRPSDAGAVRIHVLTAAEEKAYFRAAKGDLHDLGRLMLNQGCRPDELLCLRSVDVDLMRGALHIQQGKTPAARRTLTLTAESKGILSRRRGEWVFPSPRRTGEHLAKLNGPHDRLCAAHGFTFVLYDFRHTFATRLSASGCPLPTLAAILGHLGLRMVMRYVHPTAEDQARAMVAFERHSEIASDQARTGKPVGIAGKQA